MLKPTAKTKKFQNIPDMFDNKDKLMNFLRMEYWVADSPDQAGECFRQFIKDLYQKNKLIKGELELEGKKVNLKNVTMPILTIYAAEDHLVPPSSTKPLNDLVGSTDKTLYEFPGGHIGVFVGARSQKELGPTIAKWYSERS
jgi:polyhydroxyalkanoate synthase